MALLSTAGIVPLYSGVTASTRSAAGDLRAQVPRGRRYVVLASISSL